MSEASSPPYSRSSSKPLEYTSCIDTQPLSSSPNHRNTGMSASDMTGRHALRDVPQQTLPSRGQSKDLQNEHVPHRHALERDLRRLDIDCDSYILAMNNKPLDRTESISLPATPIGQMSSTFHQKRRGLLIEHPRITDNNNNNDEDDEDDEDDEEQRSMPLTSPTDDTTTLSEQEMQQLMRDEAMSNSKR